MAKIAIIGSGLVGRSWAISFARAGHDAFLWDAEPGAAEAAIGYIGKVLPDLEANDLLRGSTPDQVLSRLHVAATVEHAGPGQFQPDPVDAWDRRAVFGVDPAQEADGNGSAMVSR